MGKKSKFKRFPDYTGGMLWRVSHPDYGTIEVLAPSVPAAILTAAGQLDEVWTRYGFYSECVVSPIGNRKRLAMQKGGAGCG